MRRYRYVSRERLSSGAMPAAYEGVRRQTERLAAPLTEEDCSAQSMPDASPVKWHLAHTTWFFETFVLEDSDAASRTPDPSWRTLFNSYYVGVGDRHPRPERGLLTRPSLATTLAWRVAVDDAMHAILAGELSAALAARIELGLQHEQQHQE